MRNIPDKIVEKIKTNILRSIFIFFFENCAIYEVIRKNAVEHGRTQKTIWRMRTACWIPKATNRNWVCVILTALPLQQWLLERASVLR